jgi:hypothetical protein
MISQAQLDAVGSSLEGLLINETTISTLRAEFSDIHFSYCMDDDVCGVNPVVEKALFNLYLIDGREHCLCLTNHYDNASGVLVAELVID